MTSSLEQVLKKAHHLLSARKVDEAIQLCEKTLKRFPKSAAPCLLLAQIESQRNQYRQAVDAIKKAIKRKPKDQSLYCIQGDLYMQLQQPTKAEKAYQLALRILPQDNTIKTRLASALQLQKEKIDESIGLYEDVVKSQPNSSSAHYNLGTALKRKYDFDTAALSYKNAVRLAPDDVELRFRLSNLLLECGHFAEASDELEVSLALKPDMLTALYQHSYVNKRLKRSESALKSAERLVELTHQSPQALSSLAAAKIMSGDYESALIDCQRGLSQCPDDRRLLSDQLIALSGKDDKLTANALFKLDELLAVSNIDTPEGYKSITEFNRKIVQHIDHHKELHFLGVSHSCQKGKTSNDSVFVAPTGPLKLLSEKIHETVASYRHKIDTSSLNPWMRHIPEFSELSISGWVTKLSSQGYQQGHIHDTAWISGVYYVNLPVNRDNHAGGIEFGRAPFFYPDGDQGSIKVVEPMEGTLVLFPSYFYHRTIPFESEQDRITIAFDFRLNSK